MNRPLRRMYDWMMRMAGRKHAQSWLFFVAFIQSSFFPLPSDIMLAPMCLAQRRHAFRYALICTAGSVLGGLFGYAIGYFLFETVGRAILEFYDLTEEFGKVKASFHDNSVLIVLIASWTPIPYKVITIAGGLVQTDLAVFTLASIFGRGLRFLAVAALLWKYGNKVDAFISKHPALLVTVFFILLIGGFVAIKYLL